MPRMEQTPLSPDTVTFKRSYFYSVLVVLAFAVGVLVGYMAWGRGSGTPPSAANNNQPAAAAGSPTQQAVRRYEIPTEGFYSTGPEDAVITIVEFSDFQCPYCQKWHEQVYKPLMAAYPGQVRLVYRNLPLTQIHPQSMNAAEAAMCAGEQDAYWQYHDKLFANSASLNNDLYATLAADLKLDTAAFESCMTGHKYQAEIQSDMQFAIDLGVQSTPTFFINGLAIVGAQPLNVFQQVIDQELAGEIPQ
jgi:protein-disulfide isomerase